MTQVGVGGWRTHTNLDAHLAYIQRVAEEAGDGVITKTNGTIVNARAGINLIEGTGVTISGVDNPTDNAVDVTITASGAAFPDPVTVAHGGVGRTTLTANAVLIGNGTSAVTMLAPGTNGQVLMMTSGAPAWGTIDGGTP